MRVFPQIALAMLLSSCSLLFGESSSDSSDADAGLVVDDDADLALDAGVNFSFSETGTYALDTTTAMLRSPGGDVRVLAHNVLDAEAPVLLVELAGFDLNADSTLRVVGARPFQLEISGDVTLEGTIDLSSYRDGARGAGSGQPSCPAAVDANSEVNRAEDGGGGGGGGSLQHNGGSGGHGGIGKVGEGAPTGVIIEWDGALRGGCRGGHGASKKGDDTTPVAEGGRGGGALHLVVEGSLIIEGAIYAGGAGGQGAPIGGEGGGGGGGSGGIIWLEADALTVATNGILSAQGGGGGQGASTCQAGEPGDDGHGHFAEGAPGGAAGTGIACLNTAGDGGRGAFGTNGNPGPAGDGDAAAGGGGGGGSPGYILYNATSFTQNIERTSPPADLQKVPLDP